MGGLINGRHTQDGLYVSTTSSIIDGSKNENLLTEGDDKIEEESKEETQNEIEEDDLDDMNEDE